MDTVQGLVQALRENPGDTALVHKVLQARVAPEDKDAAVTAADQLTAAVAALRMGLHLWDQDSVAGMPVLLGQLATLLRDYEANEAGVDAVAATVRSEAFLGMLAQAWSRGQALHQGLQWYQATEPLWRYRPVRRELWYHLFVHSVPWALDQDPEALQKDVLGPLSAYPAPVAVTYTPKMANGVQQMLSALHAPPGSPVAALEGVGAAAGAGRPVPVFGARSARAANSRRLASHPQPLLPQ
jgi:hypothetical protein